LSAHKSKPSKEHTLLKTNSYGYKQVLSNYKKILDKAKQLKPENQIKKGKNRKKIIRALVANKNQSASYFKDKKAGFVCCK